MEKLVAKEKALADCGGKKADIKLLEKRLKKEIVALKEEIRMASRDDLGEFLEQNGIAFDDVRAAVKNGLFSKPKTDDNSNSVKDNAANTDDTNGDSVKEDLGGN